MLRPEQEKRRKTQPFAVALKNILLVGREALQLKFVSHMLGFIIFIKGSLLT